MSIFVKKKLYNDPSLKLDGAEIPVVDEYIFLGIIFYKKLTFIPHLKYLKMKCNKTLQLLRVMAHKEWGADQNMLLLLYISLITSKLDYGSIIYRSDVENPALADTSSSAWEFSSTFNSSAPLANPR